MANFDASGFVDEVGFQGPGMHYRPVRYVNGSTTIGTTDKLRLIKLPKGAVVLPEFCSFWADDVDPDADDNVTCAMKITNADGDATKTVIAAQNFQAVNTRVVASAATISAFNYFKTPDDSYFVYLEPGAGAIDASAEIFASIVYTQDDSGRYEVTS